MNRKSEVNALFGAALRARRLILGISQDELANLTGLHRTYVGSVDRGERNVCLENIILFAQALKCMPSVLIDECMKANINKGGKNDT